MKPSTENILLNFILRGHKLFALPPDPQPPPVLNSDVLFSKSVSELS